MRYLNVWWISCVFLVVCWIYLSICLITALILPPVHIFLEVYATTPAFLEMVEMVRLPKNEPKFFAFHRFPEISNLVDLKLMNATEIKIIKSEGMYSTSPKKFHGELKTYLKKYKNNPLILYGNRSHFLKMYAELLKEIFSCYAYVCSSNRMTHLL